MTDAGSRNRRSVTIKILDREYRLRSDEDPAHLQNVAAYVDRILREVKDQSPSDTESAAILAALNIASDLVRIRDGGDFVTIPRERLRALIDLAESDGSDEPG